MMLPSDFLREIAENYGLTEKEQEVFLEKFGTNKSEKAIADELHLSSSAIGNRLSGVYRKFSISRSGPVKSDYLFRFLAEKYQNFDRISSTDAFKSDKDIDALVQEVREKVKFSIQERCGKMRVLDMEQPIGLNDIYTDVNILEKITGRRRLEIAELLQNCDPENFDRFGLSKVEKRLPGLEAVEQHQKLMLLGKPGAGKTTFLKYLAIQCISGKFQPQRVPIFIILNQFAETTSQQGVTKFITQQLAKDKVTEVQISELLNSGSALILLDGLDEVREENISRVLKQIKDFSEQYHQNLFVITCRIAAREYIFEQFTEVEVADFDNQQIADFSNKWFQKKDLKKAGKFIQKLRENKPIQELATSPLLLTLLCLIFEKLADFPSNRSQLYKEGLDVLLKKWDATRNIERDQVYKKLSLQHKENLLSKIALITFKNGNYFFKQKEVEKYILDYILNIPNANTDLEELQLDSEAVLKSIEAQHGLLVERAKSIYSFSHLTFQEYFTAKKIVESSASQALKQLENLTDHITKKRWREVFLLAVGLLTDAGDLLKLMKDKTDALVASDEKIQQFLSWLNQKSLSVNAAYKPAAVRAFYLNLVHSLGSERDLAFALALAVKGEHHLNLGSALIFALASDLALAGERDFNFALASDLNLASDLALDLNLASALNLTLAVDRDLNLDLALDHKVCLALDHKVCLALNHDLNLESELQHSLQGLKAQLPILENDHQINPQWWRVNAQIWAERLRTVMIERRNIGHDWQFSQPQRELLQRYYFANELLVDCLNSDCYVSREIRQKIENTLLLPTYIP